jgi:hypothetical protein
LDGEFNSGDLVQVFQSGGFETAMGSGWREGDWSGDGLFSSGDFVVAFQDGGFEKGPRAAIVPELTLGWFVFSAFSAWLLTMKRDIP